MKLERFKQRDPKKIGMIIFTVACVLLIAGVFFYTSFASFEVKQDFNIINGTVGSNGDIYFAFYVNDVLSATMPQKGEGYAIDAEKTTCNNGASVAFNADDWTVQIINLVKTGTKCNLYFKTQRDIPSEIIAQLDTTGACPTLNDDLVNVTGPESTNGYVCSAPDDYGTSYYFRGNVENNWVKFAGYYWRILRVNGDGSIRMIYAGDANVIDGLSNKTAVLKNGYDDSSTKYTQISSGKYDHTTNFLNGIIGYMYGNSVNAQDYYYVTNTYNSTLKESVDSWYASHISNTSYETHISDTLFCSDRRYTFGRPITRADATFYDYRWINGPWDSRNTQYPRLTCELQNDRFTVQNTTIGNGSLTYPIAIITTDEVVLAGGYNTENRNYYLYTGNDYWTMNASSSAENAGDGVAGYKIVASSGLVSENSVIFSCGIRPVINIKGESLQNGNGTALDPYRT